MTDKEREDFEWASGFYLYDDLDKELSREKWDNWDEEKLFRGKS